MKRIPTILTKFSLWLSSEFNAAAFAAYYGAYIWIFSPFGGSSAFKAVSDGITAQGIAPEPVFALPLIVGAGILTWGVRRNNSVAAMLGLMMAFTVFCAAFISCLMAPAHSTGVPAYAGIAWIYLNLTIRRATGTQHVAQ